MDTEIALLLAVDGLVNGAIYVLMALGIVLVFNVTRVALVPFGDLAAYAALTLAALQAGSLPGTVWLLLLLGGLALATEIATLLHRREFARLPRAVIVFGIGPLLPVGLTLLLAGRELPLAAQVALTFALMLPIGPLLYRVAFQPLAGASVLVLMMVAVAVHLVITGLALLFFGPEGVRTTGAVAGATDLLGVPVAGQSQLIVASAGAIALAAWLFFSRTVIGKALRATALNRVGARLVGIRPTHAGTLAFLLAAGIATLTGILIGPVTTIYYDTGFLVGLKGFVGAVMGGFVNYPLAVAGAMLIGMIESYASFEASALKEVIVFAAIIPVVLVRWLAGGGADEDEAGDDGDEETES